MEQYILEHFDEALKQDYIKVYFQPVVRTLTRQYCGMEALARWEDPVHGLLMPSKFIGVLEKHRRIHELDIRVLNKVCAIFKEMNTRIDVPVSINLSRLDFELCDIFEIVESTVHSNRVRRSSLCIEITESILSGDEKEVHQHIDRFRKAGYEVWMDDFGSGYSSLNVLKDYIFDELKIDMRFLSDMNMRSRKIMASIVSMAKEIGIQTLAEGVETEEQFEFLRNIGCEKTQGYLFGNAMPFEECLKYVAENGMTWESPALRWYYDEIGQLNVLSARPFHTGSGHEETLTGRELNSISMIIVELFDDLAKVLYANQAFEKIASSVDLFPTLEQCMKPEGVALDHISQQLRILLEEARSDGESRHFSVYDNDYYELRAQRLSRHGRFCAILMSVTNLSQISAMVNQQQLDKGLRSLYSVYDQVSLIDLNHMTVVFLYQGHESGHKLPTGSLLSRIDEYAAEHLYPDDQDRFRQFMDPETLEERGAQEGGISIHLRTLSFHGSYSWKCYHLVRISRNTYYLLVRAAEKEVKELQSHYNSAQGSGDTLTPGLLWENAVNYAELKFFWKDTSRRFVGASRSFLAHYHFKSLADIVGKTDEDMGWHIHHDPFRDEEWKVLHEGITSRSVEGNCLVQGEDHEIVATKMPVFSHDGKIIGLLGSFQQTDSHLSLEESARQKRTDDLTGLLNTRGLYEDLFAYIDEYELRGRDFAHIEVCIDDLEDINARFGYDFGDEVIRETGRQLLECCGNTATVGRVSGSNFMVLRQFDDLAEIDALIDAVRRISAQPFRVSGGLFSIYLSVGMAAYSETRNYTSMADQAQMRRMTDDVEHISQTKLMENTGHIFHIVDEFPLAYAVFKIIYRPDGGDAIILYANKDFMKMVKQTAETLIGKRISSFIEIDADNWLLPADKACAEGKTYRKTIHSDHLDSEIEITAYPVIAPGFCAFTFKTEEV